MASFNNQKKMCTCVANFYQFLSFLLSFLFFLFSRVDKFWPILYWLIGLIFKKVLMCFEGNGGLKLILVFEFFEFFRPKDFDFFEFFRPLR